MLNLYKSNRVENLAHALAQVLKEPMSSLTAPEWIGIPTHGLGVWLSMEISKYLGVFANVYMPFPQTLVEQIYESVLGDQCPDTTRFKRESLTWSIMAILPSFIDLPEFAALKNYLAKDRNGLKLFQLAGRIASIFDQYSLFRYDMVLNWDKTSGKNWGVNPEDQWQPILWKALSDKYGPAYIAAAAKSFFNTLKSPKLDKNKLPHRVSIFCVSSLPPFYVNILAGLSNILPVHLFVLSPSKEYWAYIRSKRDIIREYNRQIASQMALQKTSPNTTPKIIAKESFNEELYLEEGNALLSSLGRLGRDFQHILEGAVDYHEPLGDLYTDPATPENLNLLTMLQSDILNLKLRTREEKKALKIDSNDISVSIHVCHSAMREVQVLYDQLMNIFKNYENVKPHDVIVMAPNIDTYAPLIEAVFSSSTDESSKIPYSIGDRNLQQEAVVVNAFLSILQLAKKRVTIQDIMDLMSMNPVRERFDILPEDVEKAQQWIKDSGIRWGIDKRHRTLFGQPEFNENTWRFGLDRLLLGMAMTGDEKKPFCRIFPYDRIEGSDTKILGRLVEFCETLFFHLDSLKQPRVPSDWKSSLKSLQNAMLDDTKEYEYEHQLIGDALVALEKETKSSNFNEPLTLEVILHVLENRLGKAQLVKGFLSRGVTFCNLLPMRSIPFKIVCLLGMNDTDYPRPQRTTGFDLIAKHLRIGDRSVRQDDRFLFLEALLSARLCFLVTYVGRNINDNSEIPPSVLINELMDVICEGFYVEPSCSGEEESKTRQRMKEHLTVIHPLQPFSSKYFESKDPRLFSYSQTFFKSANALGQKDYQIAPFINKPIPIEEESLLEMGISIEQMISFFKSPSAYFLKKRLGLVLKDEENDFDPREPIFLNALEIFKIGTFLLNQGVMNQNLEDLYPLFRFSGLLPLGTAGRYYWDELVERVSEISNAVRQEINNELLEPILLDLDMGSTRITGKLGNLWPHKKINFSYATVKPKRKIALWIEHLALNCSKKALLPKKSLLIARQEKGLTKYGFNPLSEDTAKSILTDLLRLYQWGICEPLPFFPSSSFAFCETFLKENGDEGKDKAMKAARNKWHTSFYGGLGEKDDAYVQRIFSSHDPLQDFEKNPKMSFSSLAIRILKPLIEHETS